MNIILASSSPYRQALLKRLQIGFTTECPDIDETAFQDESIHDYVVRLAAEKAQQIAAKHANAIIIGSDQALECEGKILTKPGTHVNARQQLMAMRNKTLSFYTGLCVINAADNGSEKDVITYSVSFRDLQAMEIETYLNKERPYDCAGSFKSEALGISLIAKMTGDDPTALIGLPLIRLCEMLRHQGINIP